MRASRLGYAQAAHRGTGSSGLIVSPVPAGSWPGRNVQAWRPALGGLRVARAGSVGEQARRTHPYSPTEQALRASGFQAGSESQWQSRRVIRTIGRPGAASSPAFNCVHT